VIIMFNQRPSGFLHCVTLFNFVWLFFSHVATFHAFSMSSSNVKLPINLHNNQVKSREGDGDGEEDGDRD